MKATYACSYCLVRWEEYLLVSLTSGMPKCPICGQRAKIGIIGWGDPSLGIRRLFLLSTRPAHIAILEREITLNWDPSGAMTLEEVKELLGVRRPGGPYPVDFEAAVESLCDSGRLWRVCTQPNLYISQDAVETTKAKILRELTEAGGSMLYQDLRSTLEVSSSIEPRSGPHFKVFTTALSQLRGAGKVRKVGPLWSTYRLVTQKGGNTKRRYPSRLGGLIAKITERVRPH